MRVAKPELLPYAGVMSWRPGLIHAAIVAEIRSSLGITTARVHPAGDGAILVEHIADAWGLPFAGTLPANDEIGDVALNATDCADVVVVDWLTDQTDRRGSHVALLGTGTHRVAAITDDAAFGGREVGWDEWLRLPGSPWGLARAARGQQDRVEELTTLADDRADDVLRWIAALGASTDLDVAEDAAAIYTERLVDLLAGEVELTP